MQIWMAAKEGEEASAGLLYLKVLHRKFMYADMRKPATTDRLGRGYDYKVNNSLRQSHWITIPPYISALMFYFRIT